MTEKEIESLRIDARKRREVLEKCQSMMTRIRHLEEELEEVEKADVTNFTVCLKGFTHPTEFFDQSLLKQITVNGIRNQLILKKKELEDYKVEA